MAQDEQDARSAGTAPGGQATHSTGVHQPDNEPSSAEGRGWIVGHWRLVFFLLILLTATITGINYKSLSDPGAQPTDFRSQAPQYLHFYFGSSHAVSYNVSIYLTTHHNLYGVSYTLFSETVLINVKYDATYPRPPLQRTIIITSSSRPSSLRGKPNYVETRSNTERYVIAARVRIQGLADSHGEISYLGKQDFELIPVVFEHNGSIYGHLPSISVSPYSGGYIPAVLGEFAPMTGRLLDARTNHSSNECLNGQPFHSVGIPHPAYWKCFSELANVSSNEYLEDVGSQLNTQVVDYINPPTTVNNFDYVWRSTGCCNLEPVFKLTDPEAADSRNQAAFISGIAFGVAGAAAIAVFQEFPKEFPWSRRRRAQKSSTQDA